MCALFACNKNDIYEKLAEEEQKLADYIADTYGDAAINLGGGAFLVKLVEQQDSVVIEPGDYIICNRRVTNQITEELEYTSDLSNMKFQDSYVKGGPEILRILESKFDEGVRLMTKGEKGKIYIPSRWLFNDFEPRIFYVDIVEVIKSLPEYQHDLMFEYVRKICKKGAYVDTVKNIASTSDKTSNNIVMYYIMDEGKGDVISDGSNVETKTSISFLLQDSKINNYTSEQKQTWNSNKIDTPLTSSNFMGEILKKMKKGGKVVVAVPSKLYWDDDNLPTPVNEFGQFNIPRWSVVVFTIVINN